MTRNAGISLPAPVDERIRLIRGCRVMLDADLAEMYGVPTKVLLQSVRRNRERFPADFMFRLTPGEFAVLRSQFVTSKPEERRGGRRSRPFAFTEQGVAMLSSVLRSRRAVRVNVGIMRAFVRIRQALGANIELARKIAGLERKYDGRLRSVFQAIEELLDPPEPAPRGRIGFHRP